MNDDIERLNSSLEQNLQIYSDFQKQQSDDEQQLHECLDALYRAEQCGALRSDIEEIALYAQVLQYLHKPLR